LRNTTGWRGLGDEGGGGCGGGGKNGGRKQEKVLEKLINIDASGGSRGMWGPSQRPKVEILESLAGKGGEEGGKAVGPLTASIVIKKQKKTHASHPGFSRGNRKPQGERIKKECG